MANCLKATAAYLACCHHTRASRFGSAAALLLFVAILVGCGHRGPAVEFVEGTVLFENKPVASGTVFFLPEADDVDGIPAIGRTNVDGMFRLNAMQGARAGAGTAVGRYRVTIIKQTSPPIPEPDASGVLPPPPDNFEVRDLLPAIYADRETTPLRADVRPGRNQFKFELVEPPSPAISKGKRRQK